MSIKNIIVSKISLLDTNEKSLIIYDPSIFHKAGTIPAKAEVDDEITILNKNILILKELLDLYEKARKALDINSEFYVK